MNASILPGVQVGANQLSARAPWLRAMFPSTRLLQGFRRALFAIAEKRDQLPFEIHLKCLTYVGN